MSFSGMQLDPVPGWPAWTVLAVCCVLFFAVTGWRNTARLGPRRATMLTALRLSGVLLVLFLLLRPARQEELPEEKKNHVILAGLDVSRSMEQTDVGRAKRLDDAVRLLEEARLENTSFQTRLFAFDDDARPVALEDIGKLQPDGPTTQMHRSVSTMLQTLQKGETPAALILLTDGHDFEMASPAKTALAARARGAPIVAVPFGAAGKVRDVSMRMASYQPYCYVNQKARISTLARFTGCEHEFVSVQLLRDGRLLETRQVATREEAEAQLDFIVTEPEAGQFEYEVRAQPVYGETETGNNSAITYLNVLDDKLRVLLIEGAPYWDTTFLQRSLMRNDKMDLDAVLQYAPGRARRIRKSPGQETLALPETRDEFNAYDVVLLGANVGELLNPAQQAALVDYVREAAGILVCLRGPTGLNVEAAAVLEPVIWETLDAAITGDFNVLREGRAAPPFQMLSSFRTNDRILPPLTAAWRVKEARTLAATLAETRSSEEGSASAFIHRPVGRGQVMALGVGDFWHWAFRSEAASRDALFDRLWDQMLVWLLAGSDRAPGAHDRLRTNAANLPLGEELFLRLQFKQGTPPPAPPLLEIHGPDGDPAPVTMSVTADPLIFEARHLPSRPGRYRAETILPDGTRQSARFMVYEENREATEVAADRTYLKRLAEASGGRLLEPADFPAFLQNLKTTLEPADKRHRLVSLWDQPWVFYLLVSFFGLDWYLRRRWGLT